MKFNFIYKIIFLLRSLFSFRDAINGYLRLEWILLIFMFEALNILKKLGGSHGGHYTLLFKACPPCIKIEPIHFL